MTSWWSAPRAYHPFHATIKVPGSKSATARALVLGALADAPTHLEGALASRDTTLMMRGLTVLGARITQGDNASVTVTPCQEIQGGTRIDCGLAGTVMRFLPPLALLASDPIYFFGDQEAHFRPMAPLLDALESWGAPVAYEGQKGLLPFSVSGINNWEDLSPHLTIDASLSSQFLSALLLAAPRYAMQLGRPVTISASGSVVSLPHVLMTVDALESRGVNISSLPSSTHAWEVAPILPRGGHFTLEPDLSNAGVFIAAALISGATVRIKNWPHHTHQPGDEWRHIVTRVGGSSRRDGDDYVFSGPGVHSYSGLDLDLSAHGELTPTLAALALFATTPTRIRGVQHIRGHETDRLAALAAEIRRCGGDVTEHVDGLDIRPRPLHAARLLSYSDHRMATFAALIGLAVDGIEVENIETTSKTMPDFPLMWEAMLASSSPHKQQEAQ